MTEINRNPASIMILAGGSPLVPDLEESCRRAGVQVRTIVCEPEEKTFAIDAGRLTPIASLSETDLAFPVICPVFTPGLRKKAYSDLRERLGDRPNPPLATVLDPSASIALSTEFGEGCYVNGGAALGAVSQFGDFCLVNRGCSLGHHLRVGDYASFGPGAAVQGDAIIERGAMIGTNATVLEYVTVGANSVVAAGSVVTRDVPPNTLVRGVPARIVKRGIEGFRDVSVD